MDYRGHQEPPRALYVANQCNDPSTNISIDLASLSRRSRSVKNDNLNVHVLCNVTAGNWEFVIWLYGAEYSLRTSRIRQNSGIKEGNIEYRFVWSMWKRHVAINESVVESKHRHRQPHWLYRWSCYGLSYHHLVDQCILSCQEMTRYHHETNIETFTMQGHICQVQKLLSWYNIEGR